MTAMVFTSKNVTSPMVCDISTKRWRDIQVSVKFIGTHTGGTLAWSMTPLGGNAETITIDGVAVSTTTTDTRSFVIDKAILDSITVTPTGITGATAFVVTICGVLDSDR